MNPLRRPFSENGISASAPLTQARDTRRRARFLPLGEALETRRLLSTFKVNTLLDTVAVNLKTGKDASGHISLRSAIEAANSRPNADTILLPNGTIKLTIVGANEDNAATGDLDIKENVTIKGKGSSSTVIDGNSLDRVFQVSSGRVQISGLTIQHGQADEGGGLLNSGGQVTLTSVVVANNAALGSSGAAGLQGTDGTVVADEFLGGAGSAGADGSDALGGGIFNQAGSLSLSNSTILLNRAQGGDGGQGGTGADAHGGTAGVDGQRAMGGVGGPGGSGAAGRGGGVYNAAGASISISATTFSANLAIGGKGGQGGQGGQGTGGNGVDGTGGAGGIGGGGFGGQGGRSGPGEGGGLFNMGAVSLTGKPTTFSINHADGGAGGTGGLGANGTGGAGGDGSTGGAGGGRAQDAAGGNGGDGGLAIYGDGGGVANTGTFIGAAAVIFSANQANGGRGGDGGSGGNGFAARGGLGFTSSAGGSGGKGSGGQGAAAGAGGSGAGGGLINFNGGTVSITAPKKSRSPAASSFTANLAAGGAGGDGGVAGNGFGGAGGDSSGTGSKGGDGGFGVSGGGGNGGAAGSCDGGGLANAGSVSFVGITVNFAANQANGGSGGSGGANGRGDGGDGGDASTGGNGGDGGELALAAKGGDGGSGAASFGGGIENLPSGNLTIKPQAGARKGSRQSMATNLITANQANAGLGGSGGAAGSAQPGAGGIPNGTVGQIFVKGAGAAGLSSTGIGGGLDLLTGGTVSIDNTTINDNTATTSNNDVVGTFTM